MNKREQRGIVASQMPSLPTEAGADVRHIPERPGYAVSTLGNVWSCRSGALGLFRRAWRILKATAGKDGYPTVKLSNGPRNQKTFKVSTLVLLAFVGPKPDGMEACHFPDADRGNNRLDNLRWDTRSANNADRVIHGFDNLGERNQNAKITNTIVVEIFRLRSLGYSGSEIARHMQHPQSVVAKIIRRELWRHVEIAPELLEACHRIKIKPGKQAKRLDGYGVEPEPEAKES